MKQSTLLILIIGIYGLLAKKVQKKLTHKSKKSHTNNKDYPDRVLPVGDSLEHFTSSLPPSKTGHYGFREIKQMFYDKKMNNFEIKGLFNIMDKDKGIFLIKDNIIDD